jgi:hypothetical protein
MLGAKCGSKVVLQKIHRNFSELANKYCPYLKFFDKSITFRKISVSNLLGIGTCMFQISSERNTKHEVFEVKIAAISSIRLKFSYFKGFSNTFFS